MREIKIVISAQDDFSAAMKKAEGAISGLGLSAEKETSRITREMDKLTTASNLVGSGIRRFRTFIEGLAFGGVIGLLSGAVSALTTELIKYFKQGEITRQEMEALNKTVIGQAEAWKLLPVPMGRVTAETVALFNAQLALSQLMADRQIPQLERQIAGLEETNHKLKENVEVWAGEFGQVIGDNSLLIAKNNIKLAEARAELARLNQLMELTPASVQDISTTLEKQEKVIKGISQAYRGFTADISAALALDVSLVDIGILGPLRFRREEIGFEGLETGRFLGTALSEGVKQTFFLDLIIAPPEEKKEWGDMFFFPPAEEQEAAFSLLEMFSQRRITLAEKEFNALTSFSQLHAMAESARANIVGVAYQGMEDAMLQLLETGNFSFGTLIRVVAGQIKIELIGIAIRSAVNAIYQYAKGLAAAAEFNPMAAIHFESARTFLRTAALAGSGAVATHFIGSALSGGETTRPAPGTIGGPPIRTTPVGGGQATQNVTINIYNPLSTQNWAKIIEDNIVPALNDAAENLNIRVVATNLVGGSA